MSFSLQTLFCPLLVIKVRNFVHKAGIKINTFSLGHVSVKTSWASTKLCFFFAAFLNLHSPGGECCNPDIS